MKQKLSPFHPGEKLRHTILAACVSIILTCASCLAQSDPLDSWTLANSVTGASGIAYGNGMFVGVNGGEKLISYDGANWTVYANQPTVLQAGIAYGAGAFLAFGTNTQFHANYILKSTDGMTWTTIYTSSNTLKYAAYGNNTCVFIGNNEIVTATVTSSNWNWTEFYQPFNPGSITYGNGKFVILASAGSIWSSTDGLTWQHDSSALPSSSSKIVFGNGLFVCPGTTNYAISGGQTVVNQMYVSTNLVQWSANTVYSTAPQSVVFGIGPLAAFGGNQFIDVAEVNYSGGTNTEGIWTSPDGNVWINRLLLNRSLKTFAYGQGTFVASDGNVIYQSGVFATQSNSTPVTLAISTYPGVTINGTAGATYQIQFTTNVNSAWLPLTNFTLPYSPYLWVDTTSPVVGQRFYRSVQLQ